MPIYEKISIYLSILFMCIQQIITLVNVKREALNMVEELGVAEEAINGIRMWIFPLSLLQPVHGIK